MYFVDINLFNYNLQFLTATKIVPRLCNKNFSLQVVRLKRGTTKLSNYSLCYLLLQSRTIVFKTSGSQEKETTKIKVYLCRFFIQLSLNKA